MFNLHLLQKVIKDHSIALQTGFSTRWLSGRGVVDAVRKSYVPLILAVEENDSAASKGLLKRIKGGKCLLSTWFLCDALPILTKLSKFFQHANLNVADVGPMVTASRQALLSMKEVHGTYLSEVLDKREINLVRTTASNCRHVDVPVPDRLLDSFHTARKRFLQAVMDILAMLFPDMELVDSLSVFDPRNLPPLGDEALDSYGNRLI